IITVVLQTRLYALYHSSKKLLVFMVSFFAAEVGIMVALLTTALWNWAIDCTSSPVPGDELCVAYAISAYRYIWVPCLTFDVILAVLAVWAGVKHSKQQSHSRSARLNKPRLVDVLIQGNVVYFLSPLVTFIVLLNQDVSLEIQWLGNVLLFSAPVTIAAGCRLILSLREGTSHHLVSGSNPVTISASTVQDEPWRGKDTYIV
ncbi:hypothetical protein SCLCIDRAFT_121892, partial [Scleroderma citrinum Foug A]